MWQPEKYPRTLLEALALHSLLYSLGYSLRKEVFLSLGADVSVVLKAEGRELAFRIGTAEHPPEAMREQWLAIMKEWNTGGSATPADKDNLCRNSKAWQQRIDVYRVLYRHGLRREPREEPGCSRN